jgi:hypothetical protein
MSAGYIIGIDLIPDAPSSKLVDVVNVIKNAKNVDSPEILAFRSRLPELNSGFGADFHEEVRGHGEGGAPEFGEDGTYESEQGVANGSDPHGEEGGDDEGNDEPPPDDRKIIVTGHDARQRQVTKFSPRTPYILRCRVGPPVAGNLAVGNTDVSVPTTGLKTRWIVSSTTVEFKSASKGTLKHDEKTWMAEFDLEIPASGESETVELSITTLDGTGEINMEIQTSKEPYRRCTVRLEAGADVQDDVVCLDPRHANPRTTHEWTTPPVHIAINIFGSFAQIVTLKGLEEHPTTSWAATRTILGNPVDNVRARLEDVRLEWEAHLNNVDQADLERKIKKQNWSRSDWSHLTGDADKPHLDAFDHLAAGQSLFDLAQAGYSLFDACFPEKSELRKILTELPPGSRVDFNWTERSSAATWISHVPWALMYIEPPIIGQPVDCERFLGLRLRIGSTSWEPRQASSRALGEPTVTNLLHFLYWGADPRDEIGKQSQWQRTEFGRWGRQYFIPANPASANPKSQVLLALQTPVPDPAVVLYFYCECSAGQGVNPILQFAENSKLPNVIKASDMPQGALATAPLVFANACTSVAGNPYGTNELEATFFRRNIRGFIGTETKVPVALASRFAWLFFQFFVRVADPMHEPMAAGEALTQARLFLWTQYRNPGGLFYCLVNQYDLFLASSQEVVNLQQAAKGA